MRFEMSTLRRVMSTLIILSSLVVLTGASASAQTRRYRHDNGLHRGWYVGQHRGWARRSNNNAAPYRLAALRRELRGDRVAFRRDERVERRVARNSGDFNRADRRAFNARERQERMQFHGQERAERRQFRRNHR